MTLLDCFSSEHIEGDISLKSIEMIQLNKNEEDVSEIAPSSFRLAIERVVQKYKQNHINLDVSLCLMAAVPTETELSKFDLSGALYAYAIIKGECYFINKEIGKCTKLDLSNEGLSQLRLAQGLEEDEQLKLTHCQDLVKEGKSSYKNFLFRDTF